MSDHEQPEATSGQHGPDEHEHILPPASSLIIMLILFAGVGVISLLAIVSGGEDHVDRASGGLEAFAPEDFPELDFDQPLLDGVTAGGAADATIRVPAPPFTDGIFPCSECHAEMEVNRERRELVEMHDDIALRHGPEERWCFDCHNADDRDTLHLVNGTVIGFDESYRLCGQCHGTIFRDWRNGIHGRRRGYWNGAKSYLLCAHCHDPHAPRFKAIAPLPPPVRPQYLAERQRAQGGTSE